MVSLITSVDRLAERLAGYLREDPYLTSDQLLAAAAGKNDPETWATALERARALVPEPRRRKGGRRGSQAA